MSVHPIPIEICYGLLSCVYVESAGETETERRENGYVQDIEKAERGQKHSKAHPAMPAQDPPCGPDYKAQKRPLSSPLEILALVPPCNVQRIKVPVQAIEALRPALTFPMIKIQM